MAGMRLVLLLILVQAFSAQLSQAAVPVLSGGFSVTVDEEQALGTVVPFTFSASDPDNDTLTFTLTGLEKDNFAIDAGTGTISIAQRLDYEAQAAFTQLLLTVTDSTSASATATLTVSLADVNDNAPVCSPGVYTVSLAENSPAGTTLTTLLCSDADSGANAALTLTSIVGDDATSRFSTSGLSVVTTGNALDYETRTSYTLSVVVSDGGAIPLSSTATVIVSVTHVNEFAPVWGGGLTTPVTVAEDVTVGTSVTSVAATDGDSGQDGRLIYDVLSATADTSVSCMSHFRVDATSGDVTTASALDYDVATGGFSVCHVVLRVRDNGTSVLSATGTLTVSVSGVNDNAPSCSPTLYTASLPENSTAVTTVATLLCSDKDSGADGTLTLTLTGDDATPRFAVSGLTVQTSGSPLDYESRTSYTLSAVVSDGGATPLSTTATVIVSVTPVNEFTPVLGTLSPVTMAEGVAMGTHVTSLAATDGDSGPDGSLIYDVISATTDTSGSCTSHFRVGATSGDVTTAAALDYDVATGGFSVCHVVLRVRDNGTSVLSATGTLTVSVSGINDNAPSCSPTLYTASLPENSTAVTTVATLLCSDKDSGADGTLTLTLTGDDATPRFAVSGLTVQTSGSPLDYESRTSYTLSAVVSDGGATPLSTTATVIVSVTPVNEFTPVWGAGVTTPITVSEDVAIGTTLTSVTATDGDTGQDGTLTYVVISATTDASGNCMSHFRVDSVSGDVTTASALDYDVATGGFHVCHVVLRVRDNGASPLSATATLTVSILDVNDNAPVPGSSVYSVSVTEATALAGATLLQVLATDADSAATLAFSVSAGDPGSLFQFNGGNLTLTRNLDLDTPTNDPSSYMLTVKVKDGGTPEKTGTTTVLVSVTPSNEHDPVFGPTTPTGTIAVAETATVGTVVATVSASDDDYGTQGHVTYTITGGDTTSSFSVDTTSGAIQLTKALDFESGVTSYSLTLTAKDGGSPARSATTTVSITVSDVSDSVPVCTPSAYVISLLETAASGSLVTSLSCVDADVTDTLTYVITAGNSGGKFAVNSTGAVSLAAAVDYDGGTDSYSLEIQVSDGIHTLTLPVSVTLQPVNEDPPAFSSNPTALLSESDPAGSLVTIVTATDPDRAPHGLSSYAITAVTQSGLALFSVDATTGRITTRRALDYDVMSDKFYLVTVVASDAGGLQGTGTVTVSVSDVNDNTPSCTQSSLFVSVSEGVATFPHTVVASLGCVDVEDGSNLTYVLTQTPGSHFAVSGGALTLTSALDRETAAMHSVTVEARDAGTPQRTATVLVTVEVTDVNEGPPAFPSPTPSVSLAEDAAVGSSVADVTATDPDGVTLTYAILSGDPSRRFYVNPNTGRVSTRTALDREAVDNYALVIQAVDASTGDTATTTLSITVTDVNDNPPSCTPAAFATTISETSTVGTTVLTLACTDLDLSPTLTYTLTDPAGVFQLVGSELRTQALVDFDAGTTKYDVTITVSDGVHTVNVAGSVGVGAVNEYPPVFASAVYSVSIDEDAAVGSTLIRVSATDADSPATSHGQLTHTLATPSTRFALDSATGDLMLTSPLDRETTATHTVLVVARDAATAVTATVSVTVLDVNDNAPIFTLPSYSGTVSEADVGGASVVVTVTATDVDEAGTSNANVTYSILAGDPGGLFTLDVLTGALRTTAALDYEAATGYSLTVRAVDRGGGAGSRSSTALVTVTVAPVNEHDPVCGQATYTLTLAEDTAIGTQLVQVAATDADAGSDGQVDFSMAVHAKFALTSAGWLTLRGALDFESTSSYSLDVIAKDRGSPTSRSVTCTVAVTVTDVNDNAPDCSPDVIAVTMAESGAAGTTVATLTCADLDNGGAGPLTYVISSVDGVPGQGQFAVSSTGVLSITSALDRETASSHVVLIRVTDPGGLATSATVNVAVTDVNEFDPVFQGSPPFAVAVPEDRAVGSVLLTVTATDQDTGQTVTYFLSPTATFSVDPATGAVSLSAALDRETAASHLFQVCASDSGTNPGSRQTCHNVTVTVTDVNDNAPVFTPGVYALTAAESTATGTTLVQVTALDADSGALGTVTYSLSAGNTGAVFRVDANTGHLVLDAALDYEVTSAYTLTVMATDGGARSGTASVLVTVLPVNEHTPVFQPASSASVSLAENAAFGTSVTQLSASDLDNGTDGQITFQMSGGGAGGRFAVAPSTGLVTLSGTLDRETATSHVVQVLAVDGGTAPRTATFTLTVQVDDVNDNAPACTSSYYTASVAENVATATSVAQLVCSDIDQDPADLNGAVQYAITAGDPGGQFTVDTAGLVSTAGSLDRETASSHLLTFLVSDKGTPPGNVTVQLYVTVADVNDNTPSVSVVPALPSVSEAASPGTLVLQLQVTDLDAGVNGDVTLAMTSGNTGGAFMLDGTSGNLTVQGTLDRESQASYVIVFTATDHGTPPRTATATATVTVDDVNDNAPSCTSSLLVATLAEDVAIGTTVATLTCADADLPPNNVVTYTVMSGAPRGEFSVDSATGVVTVAAGLDAEATSVYDVVVRASDGVLHSDVHVLVTLTDVNEFAPRFLPSASLVTSVSEAATLGTSVFRLSAEDDDLTNSSLVFSIAAGNAAGHFTLHPTSGLVQVARALDRETTASYTLTVVVADFVGAGALSATGTLVISVSDVNDNAPSCSPATHLVSMAESASLNSLVAQLNCSDPDTSTPTLLYGLLSVGDGKMTVDGGTGAVTLTATLDYETSVQHAIAVVVSDQGSPDLSTLVNVTVQVTPVNEATPSFPGGGYTTSVGEDAPLGTSVLTVVATDSDQGSSHGTPRYSLTSGDPLGHFAVDAASGVLTVARALDRETTAAFTLRVTAEDSLPGAGDVRTGTTTVTVTVTDVNDNWPQLTPAVYSVSVLENAPVTATLLQVTASDPDSPPNANLSYVISGGNTGSAFSVDGPRLVLAATLDYETLTSYSLAVTVSDQGTPARVSTAAIAVTVLPYNEFAPALGQTTGSVTVAEDTPVGTLLYSVNVSDTDAGAGHGDVKCNVDSGDPGGVFLMDAFTCRLYLASALDFDTPPTSYALTVNASDGGGLASMLALDVILSDVNDITPTCAQATYTATVREDAAPTTSVVTVVASDADTGLGGQITYTLVAGDVTALGIDSSTGVVSTAVTLDFETRRSYVVMVQVSDGGTPVLSSSCLVQVAVQDVNDNAPVFSPAAFAVRVMEGAGAGVGVATLRASDADSSASGNNAVTYRLSPSHPHFALNGATGALSTTLSLDRETDANYTLTVLAEDGGTPRLTGTATLTIYVDDINDNAPVPGSGLYSVSLSESTPLSSSVVQLAATDADEGVNSQLVFNIASGNAAGDFRLDALSGLLQVNQALDREVTSSYSLVVHVIDSGTPALTGTTTVTVTITDVNDNDPVFDQASYSFSVAENQPASSAVGAVRATDADSGSNAALVYTLSDTSHFLIDSASGAITTAVSLDREARDVYTLGCRVQDLGSPPRTATVSVTIAIDDVNDNAPSLHQYAFQVTISEDTAVSSSVLAVTVTDRDLGTNAAVTLTLTPAQTAFTITNAGLMTVATALDREALPAYNFSILAVDGGTPALSASATVYVQLSDVNDHAPVFSPDYYDGEVAYAGQCTSHVTTVMATDLDLGLNAIVTYALATGVSSDVSALFDVGASSGAVTLKSTATPNAKYVFAVNARDTGSPVMTSATPATVRVDAFVPNSVVITFRLTISRSSLNARLAEFQALATAALRTLHPTGQVKVWCIQERDIPASSPARRRLLADSAVDVHVYALADNSTASMASLTQGKSFVSSESLLSVYTSSASGQPGAALESSSWDYYGVEKVQLYYETSTPFHQTPAGIALLAILSLLFLIILIVIIVFLVRRNKDRPVTPARAVLVEERDKEAIRGWSKGRAFTTTQPEMIKKTALKTPEISSTNDIEEGVLDLDDTYGLPDIEDGGFPRRPFSPPRPTSLPPAYGEFDGRAFDPATGRVYEYNTRTNQRQWLSPAEGRGMKVDNSSPAGSRPDMTQ